MTLNNKVIHGVEKMLNKIHILITFFAIMLKLKIFK